MAALLSDVKRLGTSGTLILPIKGWDGLFILFPGGKITGKGAQSAGYSRLLF